MKLYLLATVLVADALVAPPCRIIARHVSARSRLEDDDLLPARSPAPRERRRCHICGTEGHIARQCPEKPRDGKSSYEPGRRIFVEDLAEQTSWTTLKDHFRDAGFDVVYASVSVDQDTGLSKRCGIVQFETSDQAQNAIQNMNGSALDGGTIRCREDRQGKQRKAKGKASRQRQY